MGVIFEREFKSLFRNIVAVCCIAVLTLMSGLYFLVNNLTAGYAGMHSVLSNLSLVAALIIPIVAAQTFTKEKKAGTDAFLCTLPVTRIQIVLGKFLGVFAFFMIPTAVICVYPVILSIMGGAEAAQGYVMLVMFVFAEAFFIALCMMISSLCKKTWKAMLISYAVLVLSFVIGLISALFGEPFKSILNFISPFRRFDPTVFDLFDISSALFYLSLTAFFLWIALMGLKKGSVSSKKAKAVKSKLATTAAILAVIILGTNVIAFLLPSHIRQLDISADGIYDISDGTKKYLRSVDDEITIYLIDPDSAEEKLHTYIRRYCQQSSKVTLKEIDTEKDTEFLKKYGMTSASLYSMVVESKSTGRWKLITSEDYFQYRHPEMGVMSPSSYQTAINYYSQMYSYYAQYASSSEASQYIESAETALYELTYNTSLCLNAEAVITEAIEYVVADSVPTMYFATGHGEKNTEVNPLDIGSLTKMPDNATVVVINDPDTDYTASEISMLQSYSDGGGRLMIITDESINEKPNLSRLLSCFGLSAEQGVVSVNDSTEVKATVNTSSDAFGSLGIESMTVYGGSSILTTEVDGLSFSKLLNVSIPTGEGDETEEKALAVSVSKNRAEKLIWLTGADSFNRDASKLSEEEQAEYEKAAYCVSYAVNWLWVPFASSLKFPSATAYEYPVLVSESDTATTFGVIFVGLIPLTLIGAAAIMNYARKKRSKVVEIIE